MLTVLAGQWNLLLFRGVIAVLFGIAAIVWPGLTLTVMVVLFGVYALLNGAAALLMAILSSAQPGFGGLLFEGVVGIAAGIATFLYPAITSVVLLGVIAAWAVLTGVAAIVSAVQLRREISGEWPLPVAGGLSLLFGVLLMMNPLAGAVTLAWLIGVYAIVVGSVLIALAIRMRRLMDEIAHA